jgi:hypothetical protein
VLSTRAHNTIRVDGLDQNRRTRRDTFVQWTPQTNRWLTNERFDFAEGVYRSGYGPKNEIQVTHTRQVLFVKPRYWVVLDEMMPGDEKPHRYEALFHLDAAKAKVDPKHKSVAVEWAGGGFRILPLRPDPLEVAIVKGQTEPEVQGWLPAGGIGKLREIPTAIYRWRASGPSVVGWLLLPRGKDEEWPVAAAKPLAARDARTLAAELLLAGGRRAWLVRRPAGEAGTAVGPIATDAEVALLGLDAAGRPRDTIQVGGSRAELRPPAQ